MNKSNLVAALVVIATISTIAFIGLSENTQAFSNEETGYMVEFSNDTMVISDSVAVSVNSDTSLQD